MRAKTSVLIFLSTIIGCSEAGIEFKQLAGTESGLSQAMSHWHNHELALQGGTFKSHGWWPWGIRVIDYDNDGDWDLLVSHHGKPRSRLLKNQFKQTGQLTFIDVSDQVLPVKKYRPGADDRPWIWDFNGDGYFDIAGLSDESPTTILFNDKGKKFIPGPNSFKGVAHPLDISDLNNDGYPDMDAGKRGIFLYAPHTKHFIHQKGNSVREPNELPISLRNLKQRIIDTSKAHNRFLNIKYLSHFINGYDTLGFDPNPIDLNGDGIGDLIIQGHGSYGGDYLGRYALGSINGKYKDISRETALPLMDASPIYFGDLNGDGFGDLLLAGEQGGVYLNRTNATFKKVSSEIDSFLTATGPYLLRAYRADFDQDGDFDFVMSNPRKNYSTVYENSGQGSFKKIMKVPAWDSNSNVIIDLNNDGKLDLIVGGPGGHKSKTISIHLNNSTKTGNAALISPRMPPPNPYAVGTIVNIFRSGDIGKKPPLHREKAHTDGSPIHFGIGNIETFDLMVEYPSGKKIVRKKIAANKILTIKDTDKDH